MPVTNGASSARNEAAEYQWLFSKSDLALTPSVLQGGLDPTEEKLRRCKGINAIYRMGEFMRQPQHVMNTASIYFHRFYMRQPLDYGTVKEGYPHYEMAVTCMFLACKAEESHRKLQNVIDAAIASLDKTPTGQQRWAERSLRADPASKDSVRWAEIILQNEETLLETLCFDLIIEHPHEILVKACHRLSVDKPVLQLAWAIINDTLRDATCVMYEASVLAAGAFYRACLMAEVDPKKFSAVTEGDGEGRQVPWTDVFDVYEEEAVEASDAIENDVYLSHEHHTH